MSIRAVYLVFFFLLFKSVFIFAAEPQKERCHYFLAPPQPDRPLNILITAGGTKEPIDDVRFITNFSSGSFGRGFALSGSQRGHRVVLLAPKEITKMAGPLPKGVELRPFLSTHDLQQRLEEAASERQWDIVLHSAAVSDYTPAQIVNGKIASKNHDELEIRLVKTPKLIRSLRQLFGRAFLVGFKLLSRVPPAERYEIAMEQLRKCRTNLCVENDLSEISSRAHRVRLVTPEGGAIEVPVSDKVTVAQTVLNFIEKRNDVHWFQTVQDTKIPKEVSSDLPSRLLKLAQDSGLLPDASGNISMRLDSNGLFAITPRGKDKSTLPSSSLIPVRVDLDQRKVHANSPVKPSIDSSVAGALYAEFPELQATLHSHSPWFLGGKQTHFPFPCGVKEEGDEVIRTAKQVLSLSKRSSFVVRLVDHGSFLGIGKELSIGHLESQWKSVQKDLNDHWQEIGLEQGDLNNGKTVAILSSEGIIGSIRIHDDGSVSPRIHPDHQGKGYGVLIAKRIAKKGLRIKTTKECKVIPFYEKVGFRVDSQNGRSIFLKYDSQAKGKTQKIQSAVAIVRSSDQKRRLVLLRGETDPSFPNFWSLPGGRVDAGETTEAAVLRELREETGLEGKIVSKLGEDLSHQPQLNRTYVIHSYLVEVDTQTEVRLSKEHTKYRWVSSDESSGLKIGPVTQKLLKLPLDHTSKEEP